MLRIHNSIRFGVRVLKRVKPSQKFIDLKNDDGKQEHNDLLNSDLWIVSKTIQTAQC